MHTRSGPLQPSNRKLHPITRLQYVTCLKISYNLEKDKHRQRHNNASFDHILHKHEQT
jgi:hypothetical protein